MKDIGLAERHTVLGIAAGNVFVVDLELGLGEFCFERFLTFIMESRNGSILRVAANVCKAVGLACLFVDFLFPPV